MLRVGTETGSLTNHLYSRMVKDAPIPEVGMGATLLYWTDRHAATVVDVTTRGKSLYVTVQQDRATRTDRNGFSECQEYTYERDPNGSRKTFKKDRKGFWVECVKSETGRYVMSRGAGLRLGTREEYYDHSF